MRILVACATVLIAGTLSFTIAQEQTIPSTDELLQKIPQLGNIPGISNFNTSSIKTEEYEKLVEDKCQKNGGPTAYASAKEAPANLMTCVQPLVNVTELQQEMKDARPHGELDTVFKKYCERVPNLKRCVRNTTDSLEPCLEPEERDSVKIIHNITSSLLEFICHNEGDRIAMFIAAGGIECFNTKQKEVGICANQTFRSYATAAMPTASGAPGLSNLPMMVLGLKECSDIENFQTCTVNVLENCTDPTPANVVDSLLNFVKRVTPCENLLKARASANTGDADNGSAGSASTTSIVNVLFITTAMFISLRFA